MYPDDPLDLDRIDQEIRINELRHQAEELAGGEVTTWESEDCPPDLAESFWQRVVDFEQAPLTSQFEKLTRAGVELPDPETMSDEELTAKLWEIIERMAEMHSFLTNTDHLSDRELYTHLWSDSFHEVMADMPFDKDASYCIDILGGCSEEDIYLYHKHYADETSRRHWLEQYPDDEMPAHEDPPYDRDRHLPRMEY